jgi:3-oxoadipate enol-lactonase
VPILAQNIVETALGRVSYAEAGSGPVRLVLHSLLTDRSAFDRVAAPLGGRFIAMDLPGFGATETARPDIDDYAHRVEALIETLELDRPILIGNGLGAFVALGTAIHHGDLVDRLLLVGCGVGFPDAAKSAFLRMIEVVEDGGMQAVIPIALRRIFTESHIEQHPELADERAEVLLRTDPGAFINACRSLLALDYRALAPTIRNPTMIVVGEEDEATPPSLAEDLHTLVPGSALVRLPGVAHAPQIQDPRGFISATRQFLEAG